MCKMNTRPAPTASCGHHPILLALMTCMLLTSCASGTVADAAPSSARIWLPSTALTTEVDARKSPAETPSDRLERRVFQLIGELQALRISALAAGHADTASALLQWRGVLATRVSEWQPGDPSSLLPDHFADATCTNIETWTLSGVRRVPWTEPERLAMLADRLPANTFQHTDTATLVDINGRQQMIGVAAWNRSEIMVAPGSILVVHLPEAYGTLRPVLAFPGQDLSRRLINRQLPELLVRTRPANSC